MTMMKKGQFKHRSFIILAKRPNTTEVWTDWAVAFNEEDAIRHARRAEELGYLAKIKCKGENPNE